VATLRERERKETKSVMNERRILERGRKEATGGDRKRGNGLYMRSSEDDFLFRKA